MSFVLGFDPKAEIEYYDAIDWYNLKLAGLGERFVNAVNYQLASIAQNPLIFQTRHSDFRESKVKDFPYLIVYKIYPVKNVIYILSIFHTSRSPAKKYKR